MHTYKHINIYVCHITHAYTCSQNMYSHHVMHMHTCIHEHVQVPHDTLRIYSSTHKGVHIHHITHMYVSVCLKQTNKKNQITTIKMKAPGLKDATHGCAMHQGLSRSGRQRALTQAGLGTS